MDCPLGVSRVLETLKEFSVLGHVLSQVPRMKLPRVATGFLRKEKKGISHVLGGESTSTTLFHSTHRLITNHVSSIPETMAMINKPHTITNTGEAVEGEKACWRRTQTNTNTTESVEYKESSKTRTTSSI